MAEQNKKNINPSVGFYDEPGFVSLTTSLRKISGDDTIPTDNYVDIYKNIYDLITPDEIHIKGGVVDISLTKDKKEIVIFYANDSTKTLPLEDNYLFQTYYDDVSNLIYFVLTNGEKITLDLNFLYDQFATKEEILEIKEDIVELQEDFINIQEDVKDIKTDIVDVTEVAKEVKDGVKDLKSTITEIKEDIDIINNIFEEGVDVKWKNF